MHRCRFQLMPFVGRSRELAELEAFLEVLT
jgi:hypothetical protein